MIRNLTLENIKEIFDYQPETGLLRWKIRPSDKVKVGDVTGSLNVQGYLQTKFRGKIYKTHRLISAWVNGRWPIREIDHINGMKTDNRIENLRDVTHGENQKNTKLRRNNKSGCTGVSWDKRRSKWQARIMADNKAVSLGHFIYLNEAIKVRKAAEVKYGFHHNHGSVLEASFL